jgi:L-iditol 2-dehydrogenase/galactitol-1-phosphate 5-dehydrogenase
MKALVLRSDKVLEVSDVPLPEPLGPDSLLIRIAHAGICNSDIHRGFGGGAYHYPLIMGHEFSGVVERTAAGSRYSEGDRVAVYPLLPCRCCPPCQTGDYAQCLDYDYFGSRRHGGFTEYLYVPEANLLPVPENVPLLHASLTEPCAVALHGTNHLMVRPGQSAAVFGGGPIGNMAAQWLALRGASPVFVVDLDPRKLALAQSMGLVPVPAAAAGNSQGEAQGDREGSVHGDPVRAILEATGGLGADCVVEAVGLPSTFLQAVQCASRFGQVVFLGNIRGQLEISEKDVSSILRRELRIQGTWNSRFHPAGHNDWTTVLEFMARPGPQGLQGLQGLRIAELISHTPTLEEGPDIFRRLVSGELGHYGKIVFRVSGDR